MKKIIAIVFVAFLALTLAVSASAAGSINASEQKVLDALGQTAEVNGATFKIPSQYINQAKNYFLTIDMTSSQAEEIVAQINAGIALIESATVSKTSTELDLHDLDANTRAAIFDCAANACEVLGLDLEYDGTSNAIVIYDEEGETIFDDEAVIKKTGADVSVPVVAIVVVVLTAVAAAGVVVAKKAQLF